MPARGDTLPRNVRVVWARLDSGSVAVGTRGTTASQGPIARFAERHWCFGKLSVLSLGEAGEWMFRDFKNRLYGTFEALFLIWHAYLMSAMIIPEFCALATDVLRFHLLVTFTMAKCALVLVFPGIGVRHVVRASLDSWRIGQPRPWRCG